MLCISSRWLHQLSQSGRQCH